MSTTNFSVGGAADSDDKVIELRELIRRKQFGLSMARIIPSGLTAGFIISIILAVTFKSRGFEITAVICGIVLFPTVITIIVNYYETKDELLSLHSQLRRRKAELAQASSQERSVEGRRIAYRAAIPDQIEVYRLNARRLRRIHNLLQGVVIVGSVSASALVTLSAESTMVRIVAVGNTLLVGLSATISTYFKFKERSINHQTFADTLETEFRAAEMHIDDYAGKPDSIALEQLVSRVERARSDHNIQERQLDQASEVTLPTLPESAPER